MKKLLLIAGVGGTLLAVGVIVGTHLLTTHSFLPDPLSQEVSFTVFHPKGVSTVAVDRSTIAYDQTNKYLKFSGTFQGGQLTFSEQATPQQYSDIPETFTRQMEQWHESSTLDVAIGKVHLTRPENKAYVAVVNEQGTLMFVSSPQNLSQDAWRLVFKTIVTD